MPYVVTLTPSDLDYGKQVTEHLKASGFPSRSVFWLYDEAADNWQLIIVTELVDQVGRRDTYLRLGDIVDRVPRSDLHRFKITVMSPQTPLYQALHASFAKRPTIEGMQLTRTVVNGIYVSGAYLYEVK
ncbi:MAG TPA: hypothetical protein VG649_06955 [Candidatus Angelobacter sp.]|jgi:hypothetical protein|nr:hypothetical protein [Candidatus Angelobacter sp.]